MGSVHHVARFHMDAHQSVPCCAERVLAMSSEHYVAPLVRDAVQRSPCVRALIEL